MGLSVSAASAILFTSFLVIFGIIYGSVNDLNDSLGDAQGEEFERYDELMNTALEIDSVDAVADTVTLTNTGATVLSVDGIDILLNGTACNANITSTAVEGDTETDIWAPMEELVLTVSCDLTDARVKIVAGNGVSAYHG